MEPKATQPPHPSADELMVREALWQARQGRQAESAGSRKRLAASARRVEERRASVPKVIYPEELPVSARAAELVELIKAHPVIVVAGETGSGKTTQLPKICLEAGRGILGRIGHTQPRRIAARTVAQRIAQELNVGLGEQVGYQVRFTDQVSDNTLIKLMTDGILLSETQRDRFLNQYDTLIIDEAHERSLNIDFLLGYLRQLLPKRPDLKVIIDRKSTRLNSSHVRISYAVFCLKKKTSSR